MVESQKLPRAAIPRETYTLESRLEPRLAVEEYFERVGHTHRHGQAYRLFEHNVIRPVLKTGLAVAGLYGRGRRNALNPIVQRFELQFPNLPAAFEGIQVLHISDFHIDGNPDLASALAETLRHLRPDLCLLTGDYRFEDRGPDNQVYGLMETVVSSIHARHGIFGILGNHDPASMASKLEALGIRMLVNESAPITRGGATIWILGVDDPFDYRTHDLALAADGVPSGEFKILMAHAPELFKEAEESGVDLYLAGHTHGGQIRFPLIGAVRNNAACPRSFALGLWKYGSMQGYTTAGVGCSSLPIRFGCPPEVALIELRCASV